MTTKAPETLALLDGDVFAYNAAAAAEVEVNWGDDMWTLHSNFQEAKGRAVSHIKQVCKDIKAKRENVVFVWSPPSGRYFRHDVMPDYKKAKSGGRGRKPIALLELKQWLHDEFNGYMLEHLEADDLMGILSTDPDYHPDKRKVIVSIDKDMQTIPGWLYNPDKDYQPWLVSEEHANWFHLCQGIGGDTVDGYSGARGMSPDSAGKFLLEPWTWQSYYHTFKSGAKEGKTELRWRKGDSESLWSSIVSLFIKAGQSEQDALANLQVARILRDDEFVDGEVKLWNPTQLEDIKYASQI